MDSRAIAKDIDAAIAAGEVTADKTGFQVGNSTIACAEVDRWRKLAAAMEPLIAKKAKLNQVASGGAVPQKSAEPVETRQEVAKAANVSHDTVAKVKIINKAKEVDRCR